MKLSENTLKIMNAINLINSGSSVSGGAFRKGNIIKARRYKAKTPIMIANIKEEFDRDFAIYDLKKFLSCINMLEDPEILLNNDNILIKEGRQKFKIRYCNERLLEDPNFFDKEIKMPPELFSFDLSIEDFKTLKSASARMATPEFAFISDNGNVILTTYNTKDKNTDGFEIEIGESSENFNIIISLDCLNFLPDSYNITLTKPGLIRWQSENITYYITMNDKSKVS